MSAEDSNLATGSQTKRAEFPGPSKVPISISILSELIPEKIKPGTILLIEFDPESQWFTIAETITLTLVQAGIAVTYLAMARPRQDIRDALQRLGLDVASSEKANRLFVDDWYSATLGLERTRRSDEFLEVVEDENGVYLRLNSLKVADLSVLMMKGMKEGSEVRTPLIIAESVSPQLRFNEERNFLEWIETRVNPNERMGKRIVLQGVLRGVHSETFYKRLESAADGVIEIRVMERDEEAKNLLRVRGLRGQRYDARWHEIEIAPDGRAHLIR